MEQQGWTLLFHKELVAQLRKLDAASERARRNDPHGFAGNANVKLARAVNRAMSEVIPQDPSRAEYRQGKTLGREHRHWRRARIGRRFRLFFRYDASAKLIVYAWMNDERTLRSAGSRSDPYSVFPRMLKQGSPPDDWASLIATSRQTPGQAPEPGDDDY